MITAIVATYGEDRWKTLAIERAIPSVITANPDEMIAHHEPAGTVATARNQAAKAANGDWLVFVDADDQVDTRYFNAMRKTLAAGDWTDRTLFTPAVCYVRNGRRDRPKFWRECSLADANWLIIGTMIHRDLFHQAGGFKDWGDPPGSNAFEDWALWATCHKLGAQIVKVPRAIYIAHMEKTSRHRQANHTVRLGWHREIGLALFPEKYAGLP